jgi:glycosyltransferase involved in cell wall biosynthesis
LIFELRFLAGNEYIENRNLVNQQVGGIILAGKGGLGKFDRDDYIIKMPKDGKMETPAKNDNPRVSVIVPAYNEDGNIEELCRQFDNMGKNASFTFEVLLIDDGSTDDTAAILSAQQNRHSFLRVYSHSRNRGLTEALQTGFSNARGEIFVFYPADLQYKPEDIPAMIAKLDDGNDLVTGWKQGKYAKQFVSNIYNSLSRRLFGLKVHDLNSVKAFRRKVVEDLYLRRDWHRYMVALAEERGFRVDEVKVSVYPRHSGDSKYSGFWRIPVGVLDLLAVKSQLTLLRKPLLFFGFLGSMMIGLGLLTGLVALYFRIFLDSGFRPLLYLVILLMVLGLLFYILGFLAEGLAAIREELSGVKAAVKRLESDQNRKRRDKE